MLEKRFTIGQMQVMNKKRELVWISEQFENVAFFPKIICLGYQPRLFFLACAAGARGTICSEELNSYFGLYTRVAGT